MITYSIHHFVMMIKDHVTGLCISNTVIIIQCPLSTYEKIFAIKHVTLAAASYVYTSHCYCDS